VSEKELTETGEQRGAAFLELWPIAAAVSQRKLEAESALPKEAWPVIRGSIVLGCSADGIGARSAKRRGADAVLTSKLLA
jgi:hypothetical protein